MSATMFSPLSSTGGLARSIPLPNSPASPFATSARKLKASKLDESKLAQGGAENENSASVADIENDALKKATLSESSDAKALLGHESTYAFGATDSVYGSAEKLENKKSPKQIAKLNPGIRIDTSAPIKKEARGSIKISIEGRPKNVSAKADAQDLTQLPRQLPNASRSGLIVNFPRNSNVPPAGPLAPPRRRFSSPAVTPHQLITTPDTLRQLANSVANAAVSNYSANSEYASTQATPAVQSANGGLETEVANKIRITFSPKQRQPYQHPRRHSFHVGRGTHYQQRDGAFGFAHGISEAPDQENDARHANYKLNARTQGNGFAPGFHTGEDNGFTGSSNQYSGVLATKAVSLATSTAAARRRSAATLPVSQTGYDIPSRAPGVYELVLGHYVHTTLPVAAIPLGYKPQVPSSAVKLTISGSEFHEAGSSSSSTEGSMEPSDVLLPADIYKFLIVSKEIAAAGTFVFELLDLSLEMPVADIEKLRDTLMDAMAHHFCHFWDVRNPLLNAERRTILHDPECPEDKFDPMLVSMCVMSGIHPRYLRRMLPVAFKVTVCPGLVTYSVPKLNDNAVKIVFEARPYLPLRQHQPVEHGLEVRQRAERQMAQAEASGALANFDIDSYFGGGGSSRANVMDDRTGTTRRVGARSFDATNSWTHNSRNFFPDN